MRNILLGVIVAAGIGLAGTAGVSAAPISGVPIGEAAAALGDVQTVQHWRWGSGRRWGGPRRHWGPRCRWRCNPYGRCWRVCW
jgi:hypothetical protein